MTLLPVAVLSVTLLALPQAPNRAEAERLARSGAHREALKQFQALAAANPDDIEARTWIARLHALLGQPERAIDVYRSIIATEPKRVDALVGLGSALTTVERFREAAEALNRAEAVASDNQAVLTEQGRLHAAAGHTALSLAYYQRAIAIEPGSVETRAAYDAVRAERAHRVEATYYFEDFNGDVPQTHAGRIDVNARVSDAVRVRGAGQFQRKFDQDESRGGGGLDWRPRHDVRLSATALIGNGGVVLPDGEVLIDFGVTRRRVTWLAGFRHLHFDGLHAVVGSPGVTVPLGDRASATLRYYHSETDFDDRRSGAGNDGFSARATGRVGSRLWVRVGYIRGFEGLENVSSDLVSEFEANTLAGGVMFAATPMTSIGATYEHQWREDDRRLATLFVKLIQRF